MSRTISSYEPGSWKADEEERALQRSARGLDPDAEDRLGGAYALDDADDDLLPGDDDVMVTGAAQEADEKASGQWVEMRPDDSMGELDADDLSHMEGPDA